MEKATTSFRRSVDSFSGISSGYYRKDGLLLSLRPREDEKKRLEHRIIVSGSGGVVGPPPPNGSGKCLPSPSGFHQRWSDVQPSDLLYLRSEMIISQNCRLGIGSLAETTNSKKNNFGIIYGNGNHKNKGENGNGRESVSETEKSMSIGIDGIGRSIINSRSVSEITGLSRFSSKHKGNSNDNDDDSDGHRHHRQRRQGLVVAEAGLVSRWLPWISSTSHSGLQSQPVVSTFAAYP
ncbi:putative ring finger protein [Corchorus olitorius]|uniref:Ring finger protein n=1 Tax=Corchorus olitorius TaxID=93759 RepID=A0A1R3IGK9_9ROSI|nr:putative ring finger protein [Corchorus olitorius]